MLLAAYANLIEDSKQALRFEDIYHGYRRQMLRVAEEVLDDRDAAEDAVHDAFLGIARNMPTVAKLREDEVRHYVLCSVRNAALQLLRGRWKELPLDVAGDVSDEDFFALLTAKEDVSEAMRAMAELPEHYRDALYYRYVMELSPREAAELLHVKPETLRKQVNRAKSLLAQKLQERGWDIHGYE